MNKFFYGSLFLVFSFSVSLASSLRVVTTIKPIYGLTAKLLEGITTPQLLAENRGSAHTLTLTPADIQMLSQADVVVWIGATYEMNMAKPLLKSIPKENLITLEKTTGLRLLDLRHSSLFGGCGCSHHKHDETDPQQMHAAQSNTTMSIAATTSSALTNNVGRSFVSEMTAAVRSSNMHTQSIESHDYKNAHSHPVDGHFWLDIDNAKLCATEIAHVLCKRAVADADKIKENLNVLIADLDALKADMLGKMATLKGKTALIDHDSLQYFETQFGFYVRGSLNLHDSNEASFKHLTRIESELTANEDEKLISAFFYTGTSDSSAPKVLQKFLSKFQIKVTPFDYTGDAVQKNACAYQETLRALCAQLVSGFDTTVRK